MNRGFYTIMAAQFLSSLADNALLIAAIALLTSLGAPDWQTPLLKLFFVVSYVLLAAWVGIFADSMPKGRVMFLTNALKAVGCLLMLFGGHPLLAYAIVGIGVNCFPPAGGFPEDLPEAGSVFAERPQGIEGRSQLAGAILNHFFKFYPNLAQRPFFEDYRKRSLVLGKEITVLEGTQTRTALALDLDQDFSLRVREADGTERTLSSGEVRVRPAKDRC